MLRSGALAQRCSGSVGWGQEAVGFSEKRNLGGGICTRASTLTDVAGSQMFRKVAVKTLSLLCFSLIVHP